MSVSVSISKPSIRVSVCFYVSGGQCQGLLLWFDNLISWKSFGWYEKTGLGKGKVADDVTLTTPDCLSELLIAPTTDLSLKETEATMPMFSLEKKVYFYFIILSNRIHSHLVNWSIGEPHCWKVFSSFFMQLSFSRCPNIVKNMSGKIAQILWNIWVGKLSEYCETYEKGNWCQWSSASAAVIRSSSLFWIWCFSFVFNSDKFSV